MYDQTSGEAVGNPETYVREKLLYKVLSGGQKHLMYVLRCLSRNPDVLICDEVLGGLDAYRQPRVLHMLQRMKCELGTSLLYISTELHQMRIIADSVAYLSRGRISEFGPAEDVLESPKHPDTAEYVTCFKSLPGGQRMGGKLAEAFHKLNENAELGGP